MAKKIASKTKEAGGRTFYVGRCVVINSLMEDVITDEIVDHFNGSHPVGDEEA